MSRGPHGWPNPCPHSTRVDTTKPCSHRDLDSLCFLWLGSQLEHTISILSIQAMIGSLETARWGPQSEVSTPHRHRVNYVSR